MEPAYREMIGSLSNSLGIALYESLSADEARKRLAEYFNGLVAHDFNKLISILYRLDIDEKLLRSTLHQNRGTDAGHILAELVIQRQIKKLESRKQTGKSVNNDIDENEKW